MKDEVAAQKLPTSYFLLPTSYFKKRSDGGQVAHLPDALPCTFSASQGRFARAYRPAPGYDFVA